MSEENLHIENHQEENSYIDEQNQDESNTENTNDESMGNLYLNEIKKLPLEEVLKIAQEVNSFASKTKNEKISEMVSYLKDGMAKYQISEEDLLKEIEKNFPQYFRIEKTESPSTKKKTNSFEAVYFHPTDKSKTWNNKGREPKWLKELCVDGKTKEDFKEQGKSYN